MPDRPPCLLFDAAGTLIRTAEPVENVYQRIFSRHGLKADATHLRAAFREAFAAVPEPDFATHAEGDAAERHWWRAVVERTAVAAGVRADFPAFDDCFHELFDHYAAGSAWEPYPEVPAILVRLAASGHRLAVVSNFDRRLHRVLHELDLARHFDLILTSADVRARKPAPHLLVRALDEFGVAATAACLVGDSPRDDAGAAAAAGIRCFLLDRPRTDLTDFHRWLAETFPPK